MDLKLGWRHPRVTASGVCQRAGSGGAQAREGRQGRQGRASSPEARKRLSVSRTRFSAEGAQWWEGRSGGDRFVERGLENEGVSPPFVPRNADETVYRRRLQNADDIHRMLAPVNSREKDW